MKQKVSLRERLRPQRWGDPQPLTPRRLASLHRRGLPPSVIAGRFQLDRERVAGLLSYYGLADAGAVLLEKRR